MPNVSTAMKTYTSKELVSALRTISMRMPTKEEQDEPLCLQFIADISWYLPLP